MILVNWLLCERNQRKYFDFSGRKCRVQTQLRRTWAVPTERGEGKIGGTYLLLGYFSYKLHGNENNLEKGGEAENVPSIPK